MLEYIKNISEWFYSRMQNILTISAYFCNSRKLFYKYDWRFISALSGYVDFPAPGEAEIFMP